MSGIKMFTGSSAAHWFVKNMEGVSSVQNAQVKMVISTALLIYA